MTLGKALRMGTFSLRGEIWGSIVDRQDAAAMLARLEAELPKIVDHLRAAHEYFDQDQFVNEHGLNPYTYAMNEVDIARAILARLDAAPKEGS